MKSEGFELYLSKDIVQGEEVPFYILWKNQNIHDIRFNFTGFDSITEYDNIKEEEREKIDRENIISASQLKQNGYLGGSLKTIKTDVPFQKAKMEVTCTLDNGSKIKLSEPRTLFTTFLEIAKNHEVIKYPDHKFLLDIGLKGSTTVFINIENSKNSEVKLVLPKEIQTAFEKFFYTLIRGVKDLKVKYPEYNEFLDFFLIPIEQKTTISEKQFLEKVENLVNNFKPSDEFKQDFGLLFYNAANIESDLYNQMIRPLREYFESSAAKNAFLDQPFLSILIPQGGGIFKGKIYYQDLLERKNSVLGENSHEKISFVDFEIIVESDEEQLIPIKELINIRRIENGNN